MGILQDKIYKIKASLFDGLESDNMVFYQNDTDQCGIIVDFYGQGSAAFDLSGSTAVCIIDKKDGKQVLENLVIDPEVNNRASCLFNSNSIACPGKNTLTIIVYGEDGERQTFGSLRFKVNKDMEGNGVESTTEYTALTRLISDTNAIKNEIEYKLANGDFKGEDGAVGATGPQGEQGIQGPQGEKGDTPDMTDFENKINEQYETIASEFDKAVANVTNGNENVTNSEIVQARGKEVNLNARLTKFDSQLDNKANKDNLNLKADKTDITTLQTQINGLASGSPKGTYANLSELQSAFPTGNDNIYVTSDNGYWNYWNGSSWVGGGVYQAISISSNTITFDNIKEGTYFGILSNYTGTPCIDFNFITKKVTIFKGCFMSVGNINFYLTTEDVILDFSDFTQYNGGERSLVFDLNTKQFSIERRTFSNIKKAIVVAIWYSTDSSNSLSCSCKYTINNQKVDNYGEVFDCKNIKLSSLVQHGNVAIVNNAVGNFINFDFENKVVNIPQHSYITCGGKRIFYNGDGDISVDFSSVGAGERSLLFDLDTSTFKVISNVAGTLTKNSLLVATWWGDDIYSKLTCPSTHLVNGKKVNNYNEYLEIYAKKSEIEALGSKNYSDKKVLIIGDSISTDYYGNYKKWVTNLIDEGFFNSSNITNSSYHGTGFVATTSESVNFIERIKAIENKNTYDTVIIFGGINDFIQDIPLGESGGDKTTQFKPAVDYFFEFVVNNFTQARIVVLSPLKTYRIYPNNAGNKQEVYMDYIKEVSKKYCLPLLNLSDESGFCPFIESFKQRWTLVPVGYGADGVHPNEEYEKEHLAPMIKNFLLKFI